MLYCDKVTENDAVAFFFKNWDKANLLSYLTRKQEVAQVFVVG